MVYLGSEPGEDGHGGVVNEVEGGQLVPLRPQHEEDGVSKVDKLGEVEPPGHVQRVGGLHQQ